MIEAWGRLGYPRRARRLYDAAVVVRDHGWPDDLTTLPGVGRYTAAAILAQADDADVPAIEVNIRRVAERVSGARLSDRAAEDATVRIGRGLHGRDRLLALMDVGALLCRPRAPRCGECPLRRRCATRGPLPDETRHRQAPFEGSFRQRRGEVMARLRDGGAAARRTRRRGVGVVGRRRARGRRCETGPVCPDCGAAQVRTTPRKLPRSV